ncbi:MAG: isocitrate lyase/phosphoenolpyruvate mutase family protein [Actinomycetota bacterium]|nr:isocitrate lyase/phosphoenolpyruvate mutase family protein [Actinomycetota bacterium]
MTAQNGAATPAKAAALNALHTAPILVLPNAWDAASARIAQAAGARAVATSSAAVAWSLGYQDGNRLPRALMLSHLARITSAVDVPVSADIESGFGDDDEEVAETVAGVLAAGAVGINIEDYDSSGFREVDVQSRRLTTIRQLADEAGVALYINARTDTYLAGKGDFNETVDRAHAYLAAGASGVFVPGVGDLDLIARLVAAIDAPLNILVGVGSPTIGELSDAGVRRASAGSSVAQAVYSHAMRAAKELLGAGTYTELADPITHPEMNKLMAG